MSSSGLDRFILTRVLSWMCLAAAAVLAVVFASVGHSVAPLYYVGVASAAVPIVAFVLLRRGARSAMIRRRILRCWARPPQRDERVSYEPARSYFKALALVLPAVRAVDDHTWDDLAMDEVLARIDVCYSCAGRNELYAMLRHCLPPQEEWEGRRKLIARVRSDEALRMALLREIAVLDDQPGRDPAAILAADVLIEDSLFPLYVTLSMAAGVLLFSPLLLGLPLGLAAIVSVFLLNSWIYYRKSRQVSSLVPPLSGLFRMLRRAGRICRLDFGDTGFAREDLRRQLAATEGLSRWFRSLLSGSAAGSPSAGADILEAFSLYMRILFLVDLIAYSRLVSGIRRLLEPLRRIYRAVGYLDAIQSVASHLEWAETINAPMGAPELGASMSLRAEGLYHPLLQWPVANSIELARPGAIVTGTNMAGKSTFLRTLGVNAILAQTIGACYASAYAGARFLVMSSIEKKDILEDGKSFYYAEAERIFRMIESLGEGTPALLLIDELLAGTNSLERGSACAAILDYLSQRNALTVAATHDVTTARRLQNLYFVHFFTDHATESGLSFDYLLRPGIVESRNAIKLLSLIGYPPQVIDSALRGACGEVGPG